jgi:hypothetical protein
LALLFQASDPYLKELIEIGGDNTKEFQALQERSTQILGLFQNSLIELQQA